MNPAVVLAAVDDSDAAAPVLATAGPVASLYGSSVRAIHVRENGTSAPQSACRQAGLELEILEGAPARVLREQAAAAEVHAVVLGARGRPLGRRPVGGLAETLITSVDKPLIVVPPDTPHPGRIDRVLVPLDGTSESARALAGTIDLARGSGLAVVVLHVQHERELPMFSDQIAHEPAVWAEEFIASNCPPADGGLELTLRVGVPHEEVVRLAEQADVDLVALGWSRELARGRGRVVRETLERSRVPTLLLAVPTRRRRRRRTGRWTGSPGSAS